MNDSRFHPDDQAASLLAAIVESSDDAIIAKDLDGTILSWNRGAERIYGYSAAEIVGRPINTLIPPDYPDELPRILERIKAGEQVDHYETVRVTKDGRIVDISLTVSPIKDRTGNVVGASAIARDITRQKQDIVRLKDSEVRLQSIVESAVDAIVVIDAHGRVEALNGAAVRLFGYSSDDVIGRNVSMLMPSPYAEEHDRYMSRYLTTGIKKIIGIGRQVTGRRKDGSTFPVQLSVGEMSIGGERKFTGILHDLTARVEMEERLREQSALVRLGEMAAVIAHEVKNPLAAIRGAIQVIGGRLPAGSREAAVMTDIIARIDALNNWVKDLLLFARPPQARPALIDVSALLASTAALLREDAAFGELRVEISGEAPRVMADPELLKIAFLNLFLNSAHAMRGKGVITVSVMTADNACQIAVADVGPGIPAEIRDKLFTPFFTTKSRGTGLGLSTVKRVIEAHHGHIRVECPPGGGTTMIVRLPLATT